MAGSRCTGNKQTFSPLKLVLSRELCSSTRILETRNWKILRALICTEREGLAEPLLLHTFNTTRSCSQILYSDGYLLVNDLNDTKCLKIFCLNGMEGISRIVLLSEAWKDREFTIGPIIEKASCIQYQIGFKTVLYFITAKSIYSLDMKKGAILEKSGLPNGHKFSGMSIDDETCLIAVSSQKNCDIKSDVLMVFAIYEYYPSLLFQQLFEMRKSIFGKSLIGAEISQGILLTLHKGHLIKSFSLPSVLQNNREAPPILHEIKCFNHVMNIGASPYHLIQGVDHRSYRVWSMNNDKVLSSIEGHEDSFNTGLSFHPDESSRLIFTDDCSGTLRIFNIDNASEGESSLSLASFHSLDVDTDSTSEREQTTTSSGRKIKKPVNNSFQNDTDGSTLIAWDYESDLDLLGVVYARPDWYRGQNHLIMFLDLIDSPSCQLLRRVQLGRFYQSKPDESSEIGLKLDADLCLVSLSRDNRVTIRAFRFTRIENGNQ